jgi:hypothetical protein
LSEFRESDEWRRNIIGSAAPASIRKSNPRGGNGKCGREDLRDLGDEDEFFAEWEFASPHAGSVNA